MSWPLGHKVASLLIFYGPDTINIYLRGVDWLRLRCGFGPGNLWAPLMLMFAAYFLAGAAAAAAGMRAGKEKARIPAESAGRPALKPRNSIKNTVHAYPGTIIILHILFVMAIMTVGRKIPAAAMISGACVYGYICALFYPRARSLLKRTGLWAGVLITSLLAGLMLGSAMSGFYMALRAFMLTLAFAAIGCELINPSIRARLERLGGGVFFETLEYAFNALPGIIAGLPSGRVFARRPLAVIGGAVARAPFLLDATLRPPVFIITGARGLGKSELVAELAQLLRAAGKKPGGICAAGLWENGVRAGFDLIDLASGARVPLCRSGASGGVAAAGKFQFFKEGLEAGIKALSPASLTGADAVFVDEIGFLELDGGGWAGQLEVLLEKQKAPLVLVVRNCLLDKVRERWHLERAVIFEAGKISAKDLFDKL
jgi:nucleoside-triphosphatase THEP1